MEKDLNCAYNNQQRVQLWWDIMKKSNENRIQRRRTIQNSLVVPVRRDMSRAHGISKLNIKDAIT